MHSPSKPASRLSLRAMGVFLLFGATMAALAGVSLMFPGHSLDAMWRLNPNAYTQMAPMGKPIGIAMLLLAVVMLCAATGWFRRRRWGWRLAAIIIATQVAGDMGNVLAGRRLQGFVGVSIAGLLLWWLFRAGVRNAFASSRSDGRQS